MLLLYFFLFFFFKQKTAYEMRISDWSSDVCSSDLAALVGLFGQVWREPFMVQKFLPDVALGDKRIVMVDGVATGGVNRLPKAGEIRSNLAVGGKGEATALTPREEEICAAIGPELARRGLVFVGIDVIAGYLTDINVSL